MFYLGLSYPTTMAIGLLVFRDRHNNLQLMINSRRVVHVIVKMWPIIVQRHLDSGIRAIWGNLWCLASLPWHAVQKPKNLSS